MFILRENNREVVKGYALVKIDGKWRQVGDEIQPYHAPEKIGRNEKCPCGSNKKYKKCCGD